MIVLAWVPLVYSLFFLYTYFTTSLHHREPRSGNHYIDYTVLVLVVLYYPAAGWLGDAYFGRYKFINFSIWVTWIMTIVSAAAVTLHRYVLSDNETAHTIFAYAIYPALYALLVWIPAGIIVHLLPLACDQLQGASSQELKSFVHWFAWAQVVSFYAVIHISIYISKVLTKISAILVAIPAICMTVMVCSNLILRKHFVIEPPSPNPLIKIYHVLRFANRNKRPRQRSAFTYSEQGIPSRIDLAKTKYGGPYTQEQVENVKSFFRVAVLTLAIGGISSDIVYGPVTYSLANSHFNHATDTSLRLQPLYTFLSYIPVIIFVPFVELVLYKVRCFFQLTTLRRASVGAVFMIISILGYLALDTTGHFITHSDVPCMLTANVSSAPTLDIDYRWLTVPAALNGMAQLFLFAAVFEFIAAQTPYGMKGIIFGLFSTSIYVFAIPKVTVVLQFNTVHIPENKPHLSCGFWLFLSELIIILVAVSLFCIAAKKYKRRERDDIPNYHSFAENYYSR